MPPLELPPDPCPVPSWTPPPRLGDPPPRIPPLKAIIAATAECFGLSKTEFLSRRRTHPLPLARQIAMYLATKMTKRSLPQIGRFLDGMDHSTVLHGKRKIEELIAFEDPETIAIVEAIKRFLATGEKHFPPRPAPRVRIRVRWTPADCEQLTALWTAGIHARIIARMMGRKLKSIQAMACKRNLKRPPAP